MKQIDFEKGNGLVPAVIQDYSTTNVLMVGFMNSEALDRTITEGKVTFFSRSRNRLWTKGETSGNFLYVKEIISDCDNDSLLIKAESAGPVCHTGSYSCFNVPESKGFIYKLEQIINQRIENNAENSYTNMIFREGINRAAQKVGEEAVELVIEAKDDKITLFKNEAADLIYHILILLKMKKVTISDIESVLMERHK
ncbi:MAG: bifunctional phosphoribosyl-AMP cyclohydrolase/phosphoribosyl-ATP diphosphatase HisIE [Bacteroidales bacterium]|jgi:phosphoribosyl-ATP pyrophosphohydrolase/phosphoribosyl-AMP cyclohydrolase